MNRQTKYLISLVVFLVAVVGFIQFFSRNKQNITLPNSPSNRDTVISDEANISPTEAFKGEMVSIDFGNGKTIEGQAVAQNAYQALLQVTQRNNLTVEVKEYKYGVLVTKIGETENSNKAAWSYLVNEKAGQLASDRFLIYPNDKVVWKFANF